MNKVINHTAFVADVTYMDGRHDRISQVRMDRIEDDFLALHLIDGTRVRISRPMILSYEIAREVPKNPAKPETHVLAGPVTEAELIDRSAAPRVTLEQLEATIVGEYYFSASEGVDGRDVADWRRANPDDVFKLAPLNQDNTTEGTPMAHLDLVTFCVLLLRNGFTVHGMSGCADPANYNRDIGQRIARADAVGKIWPLLGYELKTKLFAANLSLLQGAGRTLGQAEAQPSAASPEGSEEATGADANA